MGMEWSVGWDGDEAGGRMGTETETETGDKEGAVGQAWQRPGWQWGQGWELGMGMETGVAQGRGWRGSP